MITAVLRLISFLWIRPIRMRRLKALIENCGKGEIYADNYKIALVERIGGVKLFKA